MILSAEKDSPKNKWSRRNSTFAAISYKKKQPKSYILNHPWHAPTIQLLFEN